MNTETQIKDYLISLPETKRSEIEKLHRRIIKLYPNSKLWYLDGKDEMGKLLVIPISVMVFKR